MHTVLFTNAHTWFNYVSLQVLDKSHDEIYQTWRYEAMCDSCASADLYATAGRHCTVCSINLCDTCSYAHSVAQNTQSHKIVSLISKTGDCTKHKLPNQDTASECSGTSSTTSTNVASFCRWSSWLRIYTHITVVLWQCFFLRWLSCTGVNAFIPNFTHFRYRYGPYGVPPHLDPGIFIYQQELITFYFYIIRVVLYRIHFFYVLQLILVFFRQFCYSFSW